MEISSIGSVGKVTGISLSKTGDNIEKPGSGFGQVLSKALEDLNSSQTEADDLMARLAAGEDIDIHDATIALEEASVAFQLAMQVRTKAVEAYQEVMRLQV